ncbi:hypothetical protein CSA56_07570 [candidate division KSB3 bacterium]|uniref:Uncharacterized protein n=1 Tax=candidate division KSB3 bacterium TaxID=2044937 RepID=A0A2G6KFQ5_9BACT|nr:MAG: hypothetical protein CSA56_07570 [candidate division KSB3 bacterium]
MQPASFQHWPNVFLMLSFAVVNIPVDNMFVRQTYVDGGGQQVQFLWLRKRGELSQMFSNKMFENCFCVKFQFYFIFL